MTKSKRQKATYTAGRARPMVRRRASGWWDWFLITSLGEKIEGAENQGYERGKEAASRKCSLAVLQYNKSLAKQPDVYVLDQKAHPFGRKIDVRHGGGSDEIWR